MDYKYIVYTSIPGNFDPEIVGVTLVSVVESCDGCINHSVPFGEDPVRIKMTMDRELDRDYLIGQLEAEFGVLGRERVVLDIVEERG